MDLFSGETAGTTFEDVLQRGTEWTTDKEMLIQLAGHLRGRAWALLRNARSSHGQQPFMLCVLD